MAVQDVKCVPACERRVEGVLPSRVATEVNYLNQNFDPLIFAEAL
jgi:predicted thioredoxin/glutaredoxin